jgi:hypothetical protein
LRDKAPRRSLPFAQSELPAEDRSREWVFEPGVIAGNAQLEGSQVKRFIVQNRGNQGSDDLLVLLNKVSSQDIASFSRRLNELDGVKSVTILKNKRNGFAGDAEAK